MNHKHPTHALGYPFKSGDWTM